MAQIWSQCCCVDLNKKKENITRNDKMFQVDLPAMYRIIGITTQGRQEVDHWLTSFYLSYSNDNGVTYSEYNDRLTGSRRVQLPWPQSDTCVLTLILQICISLPGATWATI